VLKKAGHYAGACRQASGPDDDGLTSLLHARRVEPTDKPPGLFVRSTSRLQPDGRLV
jgi:hypothetical protein